MFDIFEGDLKIYNAQKPAQRVAFGREVGQCKEIMKRLTGMSQQFKQEALSKEFISRLSAIIPAEELAPEGQEMPQMQ